ncbi:Peptidoglycan/LPS O-acetylase OafA/YrhL, contains acyltransferase and SGNH-hydrolase domains [Rhodococcoides kyotonense]|uniref:Peptidoglycan/LPS O-acetylase OafA/YrhL, contains acyltransferase and SGNH-hydrolase domains n=2 Tax=Rhodococcoides kyotonense TaxID=398843 RepID=A0A239JB33_9NOCA|nr:Peptidoglycan/LPS O-acetylase OafA/YrhL, contains acyltransferase and SGNH-hydrolase domains [Rhodococcus kyotonensis]
MMNTQAVSVPREVVPLRGFIPSLEGMRAFASIGIIVTHVAFQTGAANSAVMGRIWGRFDLAVALFFALSGFLLWRPHAAQARGLGEAQPMLRYFWSRAVRILPAYWVVVSIVLLFLPNTGSSWRVWAANLSLTQVFVPLTLTEGMTQMWSLSVEVAFYLALPFIAILMLGLRGDAARFRRPVLFVVAAVSLCWAFVPVSTPEAIHHDNWLPGYFAWFAAGMLLAEYSTSPETWMHRLTSRRWLVAAIAVLAFALSATPLAGPEGLVRPEPWQFAVKVLLGAILAFALLAPLVLADGSRRHGILEHPVTLALGRWSYGIFIWHLVVLAMVFPVFGLIPFSGHFLLVLIVTVSLSIPVAAASYALVEEPMRQRFGPSRRR